MNWNKLWQESDKFSGKFVAIGSNDDISSLYR